MTEMTKNKFSFFKINLVTQTQTSTQQQDFVEIWDE